MPKANSRPGRQPSPFVKRHQELDPFQHPELAPPVGSLRLGLGLRRTGLLQKAGTAFAAQPGLQPLVGAVSPEQGDIRELRRQALEQQFGAAPVMDIGRVHLGFQQVALGVDQHLALAARDLLAAIIAARPADFGGAHGLAIDDGRRRLTIAADRRTVPLAQLGVDLLPDAGAPPLAEMVIDRRPGRILMWQCPPLAAGAQEVEGRSGEAATVAGLVRRFTDLVRGCGVGTKARCGAPISTLEGWLREAKSSGVAAVTTFTAGLQQDGAAVRAALTTSWSSGQTEGQVGKLKMLKRQTFGRGSFDLLRRRVLLAA